MEATQVFPSMDRLINKTVYVHNSGILFNFKERNSDKFNNIDEP